MIVRRTHRWLVCVCVCFMYLCTMLSCVVYLSIQSINLPTILRDMRCGGVPYLPYTCWCARLLSCCLAFLSLSVCVCVCAIGSNSSEEPVHTSGGRVVRMYMAVGSLICVEAVCVCVRTYGCIGICVYIYTFVRGIRSLACECSVYLCLYWVIVY